MLFSACLLVCVQACLFQSVFGDCIRPYPTSAPLATSPLTCNGALDLISAPFVASLTAPLSESFLVQAAADASSAYGGAGIGEAAVAGELPSVGTTGVVGQVPVLGAVEFGGIVPAAGTVSISATCACGCSAFI